MQIRKIIFLFLIVICCDSKAQQFHLDIQDNTGIMHQMNVYHFSSDSLIITAKTDYGRNNIEYLRRHLCKK